MGFPKAVVGRSSLLNLAMQTAIKAKRIVDGTGAAPLENGVLLIDGNVIMDAGTEESVRIPEGTEVITLPDNETLLPGLIDGHNHPSLCWYLKNFLTLVNDPHEHLFLRAIRNFQINLRSGVTSIRCLAEKGFVDLLYRRAVEQGLVIGPRIKTCTRGFRFERGHGFLGTPVQSVEQLRRGFAENVKAGADFLKFFVTGTVLVDREMPSFMTQDEIQAAADAAHDLGKEVAVHAVGGQGLHDCLSAGVDCIEHGYFVDDEAIARMKGAGCWLVITSGIFFDDEAIDNLHSRELREALREQRPLVRETLIKAINADLKVAVGTDGLVGKIADEICFLVAAGMTSLEAIRVATLQGARLLGIDDEAGSLERGKRADVISVVGNPLEDVSVLENVHLVMKDGQRLDLILDQMSTLDERATKRTQP
jgi:imidazolonepropionase-like amidohydrolase